MHTSPCLHTKRGEISFECVSAEAGERCITFSLSSWACWRIGKETEWSGVDCCWGMCSWVRHLRKGEETEGEKVKRKEVKTPENKADRLDSKGRRLKLQEASLPTPTSRDDAGALPLARLAIVTATRPLEAGWTLKRANGSVGAVEMPSKNSEVPREQLLS